MLYFNPHSPCGERRFCREGKKRCSYFNPHSPCGERLLCVVHLFLKWIISIHTPHAGSDAEPCPECGSIDYISIHTPHAGSDPCTIHSRPKRGAFQSTLPMRGATCVQCLFFFLNLFQSTLPMRGATLTLQTAVLYCVFQSTLPMRGATWDCGIESREDGISIHTPHAGSDHTRLRCW